MNAHPNDPHEDPTPASENHNSTNELNTNDVKGPLQEPSPSGHDFQDLAFFFRNLFSMHPLRAFTKTMSMPSTLILLGINAVLSMLGSFLLFSRVYKILTMSLMEFNAFGQFFTSLLSQILILALEFGLLFLCVRLAKYPNVSVQSVFSVFMMSMIPANLLLLLSFFIGLISFPMGMSLYASMIIVFFLTFYLASQKYLGTPTHSPYWLYIGSIVIFYSINFLVIVKILTSNVMRAVQGIF